MRRLFLLIFIFALLFSFQPARAQGAPTLSSVDVWIWPEYDQPSVLVIYRMIVSPDVTLPTTLTFRIPAAAIKPAVVAVGPATNAVSDVGVKFSQEPDGEWLKINIEVTGPAVQLEFYEPSINKQGEKRDFTYTWPGDYAVQTMRVELQQPYDARNMTSDPVLGQSITEELTYYLGTFGPLAAGEPFSLKVNYAKKSDEVSVFLMPVQSSGPVDANTAGRVNLGTYVPWLIAGVGVLLAAGGMYYYFRGQSHPPRQTRRRHIVSADSAEGPKYCAQCGTRARPGDRFCRTCGTRIRQGAEE
jgi:hypothetical protein